MPVSWLDEMAVLASDATGVDTARAAHVGRLVAAERPGDAASSERVSGLNHDGSPLQLCITAAPAGAVSRVLADPASGEVDLGRRFARARGALDATLADARAIEVEPACRRLLYALVPDAAAVRACPDGVLWLGAGLSRPGVAVYVDARRGGREAVHAWLTREVGETAGARTLLAALGTNAVLQSAGVEAAGGSVRFKVYWRLGEAARLADAGLPSLADPRFAHFVRTALAPRGGLRLSGVVLSAGITESGDLRDAKLDLCGCPGCLALSVPEWRDVLAEVADHNGIPLPPVDALLERAEIAFVGFGLTAAGEPRLNVYAKESS